MMKAKFTIVLLIAVIFYCGVSTAAVWLPSGTQYVAPEGGTLVIDERYGSDYDGVGSWVVGDGTASIEPTSNSVLIVTEGGRAQINLPFQPEGSAGVDYVIDVGLKGWSADNYVSTWWHAVWQIQSAAGNGMQHRWVTRNGNLEAMENEEAIPFAPNTEYVLRFTSTAGVNTPTVTTNTGEDGTSQETHRWVSPSENFFAIWGTGNTSNTSEIAWVKIYTDVTTEQAPLAQEDRTVPWTPFDAAYLPPVGGSLVLAENYGSDHDGAGSWIVGDGQAIIDSDPNDSVLITTEGGRAQINLPFQPEGSAGVDYVIDVGLKGWDTDNYVATWWHSIWWIHSAAANGMRHRWVTRNGNLDAMQSGEAIPYARDTGYVLRFSSTAGENTPTLTTNFGTEGISQETHNWSSPSENFFALWGTVNAATTSEIAWIRIYTDVATTEAPLEVPIVESDVPWTPAGTAYVPPAVGELVISENYGYDYDGVGSWKTIDNSWIVEIPDGIAIFTNGGRAQIDLPFQPEGSAGIDYVIDVGLKGWSAEPYHGGWWHINWWIQSAAGNGMQHRWMTHYGDLRSHQNQQTVPFARSTGYVVRVMSRGAYVQDPILITNLGNEGYSQETHRWAGDIENFFGISGTASAENLSVISWVRIYKDAITSDPPLVEKDQPEILRSDISGPDDKPDGYVNIYDLKALLEYWLHSSSL